MGGPFKSSLASVSLALCYAICLQQLKMALGTEPAHLTSWVTPSLW